ncbi:SPARC related modular calcium binding-like protein magu isoform X2 [Leptinotarsa decemlineata]|uniref:SPARC related modular calcium binding-like protein magu isoform X2 n=1 Tax=Leptinotarsa decemlineata TaxID=7539 RepID=UPI003D3092DA
MWLNVIFPFTGYFIVVAATRTCNPKSCGGEADDQKSVCGSDGLTYPNRCIFALAHCENQNLTLTKRGPCKKQRTCSDWQLVLEDNPAYNNSFNPICRPDGTYDSTQCHFGANYCWCVTPEGIPLPYTSSKLKPDSKPRCGRNKKSTRRRSPSRRLKARICKRTDKSLLNNNLINSFHTEFTRDSGRNESDKVVITWKFQALDQNNDNVLDKAEYKDLRKIVKKAVKPKKCARNFPRSCDIDRDDRISLQEWGNCLTRDGRMDLNDGHGQNTYNDNGDYNEDYGDSFSPQKSPPHGVLSSTVVGPMGSYEDESADVADDPTDCFSDRTTAMSEGGQPYVPECTPDGRYHKVQCYKSAGYCWCVNEDSGKNIPGTSIKNGTPHCDHLKSTTRTMKGCPEEKKEIFLKELLTFLHSKMNELMNTTNNSNLAWINSKEEQAATWSFVVLDKNKNKMWERSEWKTFKDMVGSIKGLRKCGKKLPRYCDSNRDRQVSMTEWLDCLNIRQGMDSIPSLSSRAGKTNPLSMLKDD